MKCNWHTILLLSLITIVLASQTNADERWEGGFDTAVAGPKIIDSVLTLDEVLNLVAASNPSLRSMRLRREAAEARLRQAGLWSNPEFESEIEEAGWDAPGFSESEITFSLSQEFELFGQRDARKQVALSDLGSVDFEMRVATFDLYLETKTRYHKLLHSQRRAALADSSVVLAEDIVNTIEYRMNRGVALQSELLLAQLEMQRANLTREDAQQELRSAQVQLAALWNGSWTNLSVIADEEPDFQTAMERIQNLDLLLDSTRGVRQLHYEKEITRAERKLATAEAKPGITLFSGYKRFEADKSNTLLLGISLPIPLLNRNQGKAAALDATLRSLEFKQERAKLETKAFISSATSRLKQLMNRHTTLDTLLLPTAEKAYKTLVETYNLGRIPYTSLLEVSRALIELRFEHNNVIFDIYEQLIELEKISGIKLSE